MAGPDPDALTRQVALFPRPPDGERYERADDLLDGALTEIIEAWYPELERRAAGFADGDLLREDVLTHVEAVPSVSLGTDGDPEERRREDLAAAADLCDEVAALPDWYADLRRLVDDDPRDLTLDERLLHGFGYTLAHGLFVGADSPAEVVKRLRVAYRSVGVRIDETETDAGTERTTFTCPYRNLGAERCGRHWVCHEKLDRVDDGYVTYLAERGIDYQRPRHCGGSERCFSEVREQPAERRWPETPVDAVVE